MDPILGTIALFGFGFVPKGWALCDGSLMSVQQNSALYSLLGITYGGNGQTTFGLPDLRGRVPLGYGQGRGLAPYTIGQMAGNENVTLNTTQLPAHTHQMMGSTDAQASGNVQNNSLGSVGRGTGANIYANGTTGQVPMGSVTAPVGGSQPHTNMQPYLVMNYCIAIEGIYPTRS